MNQRGFFDVDERLKRVSDLGDPLEAMTAVILPEHMHFLWRLPGGDHDFPARLSQLKAGFTRRLPESAKSNARKGERGVWQSRYWEHLIRSDEDLSRHVGYIHWNPVKHGLVADPDEWPFSTWRDWKKEKSAADRRSARRLEICAPWRALKRRGKPRPTARRAVTEAAGQTPVAVGASRPICEECMAQLRDRGIED